MKTKQKDGFVVDLGRFFCSVALLLSVSLSLRAESPFYIGFFGGATRIGTSGKISEYSVGINPFPVTPSHNDKTAGAIIGWRFSRKFRFELSADYNMPLKDVFLTDPSDGDRIHYKPLAFYNGFLSLVYEVLPSSAISPFLRLGGGAQYIRKSGGSEGVTERGYAYAIEPANSSITPAIHGSLGGRWRIISGLALRLEAGVLYASKQPLDVRLSIGLMMF
jgi:hypothetical protein